MGEKFKATPTKQNLGTSDEHNPSILYESFPQILV